MQEDEFKAQKIELYKQSISFIQMLSKSNHPITICWLLEILHILTSKFSPPTTLSQEASLIKKMDGTL